jgi:putative tricarboxylic transport membrane protein
MPGLGSSATIAMLIPLTYKMDPTSGLIMLAGIYYGSKYGGSTTSILLNVPGESSAVVTCLDGYQMAKRGRAGAALGIAAIASFVAGTVGVVGLMLISPPLAQFALSFSAPEFFGLMCLGLAMVALLAGTSIIKSLIAMLFGLSIAGIGIDLFSSTSRFTFGQTELLDGVPFVAVAIGLFAIAEVMVNMEAPREQKLLPVPKGLKNLLPTWQDIKDCRFAFLNGSVVGFIVGVLPGAGSAISAFLSYGLEKAVSKHPEKFGTGVPEGVAAPEGANNADTGGSLVPLLTLGIPGSGATAMLLAAFILWGVRPGPMLIGESPDIFWGLVASMYVGNIMLVILNIPLVPLFAQLLKTPLHILFPGILGVAMVGVFGVSASIFHLGLLAAFGLLGYAMRKLDYPAPPLLLGFVLGDQMEQALRQSLTMSQGDISILFERPMAAGMLIVALLLVLSPALRSVNAWRTRATTEGGKLG